MSVIAPAYRCNGEMVGSTAVLYQILGVKMVGVVTVCRAAAVDGFSAAHSMIDDEIDPKRTPVAHLPAGQLGRGV